MITQKRLKELVKYDYKTGDLVRVKSLSNRIKVGDSLNSVTPRGYLIGTVDSECHHVHRLVWLYVYGYLPEGPLDHIDRNKTNNKISNLREVGQRCNLRNTGNFSHNSSGVKGVSYHKQLGKWEAYMKVNKKKINLGVHSTFWEAVCHRLAGEQAEDWEGCDSSSPAYKFVNGYLNQRKQNDLEVAEACFVSHA